ncbi:AAEL000019-PA [Aedes aegypti]|uniref:I23Mb n=2 Tax=Aedes aegypti TaxID=7159 RepID=Q1HRF1_AEDAE|nr:i23Mb [Aedes aegypti]EAT48958.1 AAEL000019-PA [Aedes aegypti]
MRKQTISLIIAFSIAVFLIVDADAGSEYCPPIAKLDCDGPCVCVTDRDSSGSCPEGFKYDNSRKKCTVNMMLA